uniref:Sphingolipid delta4-desaturase N-terminal domain-containing protein n=1 Tax=Aplanochytrium stocchinoi TaxID=215587 RepID=A0A6S8BEY6_9STRA
MCPTPSHSVSGSETQKGNEALKTKHEDYDVFHGSKVKDIQDNYDLQNFVWSMTDEPHASRRKKMIKEYPELKKLMGHEPLTKYIVTSLVYIQLHIAVSLRNEAPSWNSLGTLRWWVVMYTVGATITQMLFLACHEISHNLAFRKFSHNKMFGLFANIPMVFPFFMYFKFYHNEHHKYQGVEGVDTDLPTAFEAKLLSNPVGKAFFLFFQTWFYALRPLFVKQPVITRWHVVNYAVQFLSIGAIAYFFGWGPIVFLLVSDHFAGGFHPLASHFIAEHYAFKGDVETYSYYGPLNLLTWNVGFHNEHHDFPTVPWSRLPCLYELAKDRYYKELPYHESWTNVLVQFLFNPKYTLYNRVKRADKHNIADKNYQGAADYTGGWLLGLGMKEKPKEDVQ